MFNEFYILSYTYKHILIIFFLFIHTHIRQHIIIENNYVSIIKYNKIIRKIENCIKKLKENT